MVELRNTYFFTRATKSSYIELFVVEVDFMKLKNLAEH